MFVFPVTGQNPHPRVVDVKELSVRRQLHQMFIEGETYLRHPLTSFKLHRLRKRHAATLMHTSLTIKGHSARIFVERNGDVSSLFFHEGSLQGHREPRS